MSILISIIIPVYNVEHYIRRCIDSVLIQDYRELDVVLVDDGSTDNSGEICDEFAEKDERVHVIHQDNQGASIARLNGLKSSQGEFVTFVDSDDWISPNYVSKLYKLIDKYQVNISSCRVCRVHKGQDAQMNKAKVESQLLSFDEIMPRFFKYEFWGFPGKLYSRSLFNHIDFPNASLSEDYYVMVQLFNNNIQMAYTKESLYYYEYHENSLSHQKLTKRAFEEFTNVKAVYDYTRHHMPEYTEYAFSNVIGTSVKLFALSKNKNTNIELFKNDYSHIYAFLMGHFGEILRCKPLNFKVKFLSYLLLINKKLFFLLV